MPAGDRIAARAYQLSEEEANIAYPLFMQDIDPYLGKLRDPSKRLLASRSIRIFLRFLADTGLEDLRVQIASRKDIDGNGLRAAILAFYLWVLDTSSYSEDGSLKHAMGVGRIFRWLGKTWPRCYPQVTRIQFRKKTLGSSRVNKAVPVPVETMRLDEIATAFGPKLAADLAEMSADRGAKYTQGFRLAISWAWHKRREQSSSIIAVLRQEPGAHSEPAMIKELLDSFEQEMAGSMAYSPATVTGQKRSAATVFEALSKLPDRSYSEYSARYTKSTYVKTVGKTLAHVFANEHASRDEAVILRRSIDQVKKAAMDALKLHVEVFDALAPAREQCFSDIIEPDRREALCAISILLQAERKSLMKTGYGQFSTRGKRFDQVAVDQALALARIPETWRLAGAAAFVPNTNTLSLQQVRALLVYGLGASRAACVAAKIVFCSETAWNRQPIDNIPSQPIVFSIEGHHHIASAAFLAVFKKRAGHDVVALLDRRSKLGETARQNLQAAWEEAERNGQWRDSDQRCFLDTGSGAFEALELLRPLVEALNDYSRSQKIRDRFFKFLRWAGGVALDDGEIGTAFKEGQLSKPGLTFPAIRKTVLQLRLRRVGSVDSLRAGAGHASTQVLMPYYLNSPDLIRELEQSVRFFQNAVQALVASEVGSSIQVLMSPEDLKWFYNLARTSGIASAVGYDVAMPISREAGLAFEPTNEAIRGLLSLELALSRQIEAASARLRSLVGIPLTAFVRAIRARLNEAGFKELVQDLERQLLSDVDEGRTVLQRLF